MTEYGDWKKDFRLSEGFIHPGLSFFCVNKEELLLFLCY